ncbi:hypothetical protein V8F06_007002 [Rhypophila decipiens]
MSSPALEGLGAAGSVVGLIGAVQTCGSLLAFIATIRSTERELQDLSLRLRWQYVLFRAWAEVSGFSSEMMNPRRTQSMHQPAVQSHIPNELLGPHVMTIIQQTVGTMIERSRDATTILQKYREPSSTSAPTALVYQPTIGFVSKFLLQASGDMKKLTSLVEALTQFNDSLNGVLPLIQQEHRQRAIRRVVVQQPALTQVSPQYSSLGWLAQSEPSQGDDDTSTDTTPRPQPPPPAPFHSNVRLSLSESDLTFTNNLVDPHREVALLATETVLVEWKYYSKRADNMTRSFLDSRVHMLAQQLHALTLSNKDTGLLPFVGYFHDRSNRRYGIVFKCPGNVQLENPAAQSLQARLRKDHLSKARIHDLDQRFRIARTVVKAVYSLLEVSWLHKNLNGQSILLFDGECTAVSGFSFSRRDAPGEMSEELASYYTSNLNQEDQEIEQRLYMHPDYFVSRPLQNSKNNYSLVSQRYKREHDVYSLGILLLEIGLWCSARRIFKRCQGNMATYHREVRERFVGQELRGLMGRRYTAVVGVCLDGLNTNTSKEKDDSHGGRDKGATTMPVIGVDENEEDTTTTGKKKEEQRERDQTVAFLERFEKLIVRPLEDPLGG